MHAALLFSGHHQPFLTAASTISIAQRSTNSPRRRLVISCVPARARQQDFDNFHAQMGIILLTGPPHRVLHLRMAISPPDAAQEARRNQWRVWMKERDERGMERALL